MTKIKIEKKNIKKIEVVSELLAYGTIIETVLDPITGKTNLVVFKNGISHITSESKVSDGRTIIPIQATNPLIKSGLVKFASKACDYGNIDQLVIEIKSFINRYVDLSEEFEITCAYYVLLSWVYDDFNELPYLRKIGDFGSGKTRFLKVMASVCNRSVAASGGTSTAALFHIIDKFKGTLILDEADFSFSDQTSDIAKILNNGNASGFPILRVSADKDGKFTPISYDVFCPKIIASRSHYQDQALESRFITESFRPVDVRSDIPTTLPECFEKEALQLRNKLLSFRFASLGKIKLYQIPSDLKLEGRIKQIFTPLLSMVQDSEHKKILLNLAKILSDELQNERSQNIEAQVLSVIKQLQEDDKNLSIKNITNGFFLEFSDYHNRRITAKWIGFVVRKKLNLKTRKSNGNYIIEENSSLQNLKKLYRRYMV